MREIKFRAWIKSEEKMYVPTDIFLCNDKKTWAVDRHNKDEILCKNKEDIVLMQFTGLKDKKWKRDL